jgi:hypothetical protein
MFQATMRCNLWDLVDEGIDEVLDRLKGEAGITGISMPLVCPPVDDLRIHKGISPRTFRSRGGAQFQPHAEFYANTRLKPVVAEWLKKSNPLPAVAEACAKRGLSLRGEVNCCHSPVMVEKFPFAAVKDVFGEASPTHLCPINPDVMQYAGGLISDLQQSYGLAEVRIQSWGWRFSTTGERFGVAPMVIIDAPTEGDASRPAENAMDIVHHLIKTCFCESCRQRADAAGINGSVLERVVQRGLEQLFTSGETEESVVEFCSKLDEFEAYQKLQNLVIAEHQPGTVWDYRKEAFWYLHLGVERDSASLVRAVSSAVTRGKNVMFTEYGKMPLVRLAWIKQAVRKAQRDVE